MKKQHGNHDAAKRFLFVCYGTLMLYLLFVRGRIVESELSYWQRVALNYNLTPLRTVRNYWDILARPEHYLDKWGAAAIYKEQAKSAVVNLVGNVVMFVPLGMLLPAIWQRLRRFWKTVLLGAGVIVAVEIAQLLSLRGRCDVDDLILNLIGIAAGYVLWRSGSFLHCKRR